MADFKISERELREDLTKRDVKNDEERILARRCYFCGSYLTSSVRDDETLTFYTKNKMWFHRNCGQIAPRSYIDPEEREP
jgi:hypothetical protein